LVSSKVGVLIIGIGIIAVILLAPREILSPERVMRFAETFKRPEQQVSNGTTNGLPMPTTKLTNGVTTTLVSPKPVSTKLQAPISTTIEFDIVPSIDQKPAIPFKQTVTVTTPEEKAIFDIEIAKLKEELASKSISAQFTTIDPITEKKTIEVFLAERL